jgi:serine/threonine-protein kinase RsbT
MTERVDITSEADVARACHAARGVGERLGFAGLELAHLITATAEIAGNAWRHGGGGRVELERVQAPARVGVKVTVVDSGPGIGDVEAAMRDGWSSAGSMGVGLPGARRLMDEFGVGVRPGGGTRVTMTRWRQEGGPQPGLPLVDWAAAPAPAPPGRRALVCSFGGGVLLAVVAGVGSEAETAAETAGEILNRGPSRSPIALAEACHAALAATGGAAALGLASMSGLDPRITWLALGHVRLTLLRASASARPAIATAPAVPGAAGRRLPSLSATTVTVGTGDLIVLAVGGRAPTDREEALVHGSPGEAANRLLGDAAQDALMLVARRR